MSLRSRIAELLTEPVRSLGSVDTERDALVGSCATFAVIEQFRWAEGSLPRRTSSTS